MSVELCLSAQEVGKPTSLKGQARAPTAQSELQNPWASLPCLRIKEVTNNIREFPNLLSQFPAPSTRVAHHGVVVPSAVRSNVQLLYSFPSMKNGNWHRRPSVVVQFAHGVSGVVDGLGLGLLLEPVEAEHGCSKSPEAISAQLESVAD